MSSIDTIKKFENVGFTRGQAEMQVKTFETMKMGLMTKEDGLRLEIDIKRLEEKMDLKFYTLDERFRSFEVRYTAIDDRIDGLQSVIRGLEYKIQSLPSQIIIKQTIILAAVMGALLSFLELVKWYFKF